MHIRDALLDQKIKKVVVIAHSEGGIIISSALDNLLSDLPRQCTSVIHQLPTLMLQTSNNSRFTLLLVPQVTLIIHNC
jgi:esterase/lipase superfamily enzyme